MRVIKFFLKGRCLIVTDRPTFIKKKKITPYKLLSFQNLWFPKENEKDQPAT